MSSPSSFDSDLQHWQDGWDVVSKDVSQRWQLQVESMRARGRAHRHLHHNGHAPHTHAALTSRGGRRMPMPVRPSFPSSPHPDPNT